MKTFDHGGVFRSRWLFLLFLIFPSLVPAQSDPEQWTELYAEAVPWAKFLDGTKIQRETWQTYPITFA